MADDKLNIILSTQEKGDSLKTLGKFKTAVAGLGIAAGAAAVALGVTAVKEAAKFQKAISDVSTLITGDATGAMMALSDGIKNMMLEVPVSADDLGASAYSIVSAGISDTAQALNVLEASAKLSVAGLGTAAEATDLMTSSLNAFQIPAEDAAKVSDILFKTVKAGKTTVSELAVGFGKVAPVAKSMSVSLEELQAATAAVTTTGIKASEVQTGMKAVLANLIKPTKELQGVYQELGVTTGRELIEKSGGLVEALTRVKEAAQNQGIEFGKVLSSVEGLTVAESLLGAQNEAFTVTLASMTDGSVAVDEAFKKQTETFSEQWKLLKNSLKVIMIDMGDAILPAVTDAVKELTEWYKNNKEEVTRLAETFAGAFATSIKIITPLLVAVADLTRSMSTIFVDAWGFMKNHVIDVVGVIGDKIGWLMNLVSNAIGKIKEFFGLESDYQRYVRSSAPSWFVGPVAPVMGPNLPGRQFGGNVGSGQAYRVGENGPETFVPGTPGRIVPSGGSGITININGGTYLSTDAADKLVSKVVDRLRLYKAIQV